MSGHTQLANSNTIWGGGESPLGASYGKLMMWIFLVSDALTFGALLVAYGFIRHASSDPWPVAEQVFQSLPFLSGKYPLIYVALMTFILIVSSVTMVLAVEAGHRMDKKGVVKWMGLTVLGGFVFLGSQAWEWSHFIHGSGGGFQISAPLSVNATNEKGEVLPMQLTSGSWVHFTSELGHAYEHAIEHGDKIAVSNGIVSITPSLGEAKQYPLELVLNKYTLVHKDGVDYREMHVTGADAEKLLGSMVEHSLVFGANLHKNEYAIQQQYANFFFFITGFHGFHVLQGIIYNLVIWIQSMKGVMERRGHYEMVEKVGLFWHFVDLVWVFVFTFFYLV